VNSAKANKKPYITNPTATELSDWIDKNNIKTLNVAGNRNIDADKVKPILKEALGIEAPPKKPAVPVTPVVDLSKVYSAPNVTGAVKRLKEGKKIVGYFKKIGKKRIFGTSTVLSDAIGEADTKIISVKGVDDPVKVTVDPRGKVTMITQKEAPPPAVPAKFADIPPTHSLASINKKTGKISLNDKAVQEDWDSNLKYLKGESKTLRKGSLQKKVVFEDIDLDKFKKELGSVERYKEFILAHEEGHNVLHQDVKYPKDWQSPEAIKIEKEANEYAFDKMGIDLSLISKKAPAVAKAPTTTP